jgi:AraC-like DNA-binding protein
VFVLGIKLYRDIHCPFFELKLGNKCGTAFKKHSHEWFSLGIVRNGETSFWYDGRTSELHEGNVVFMPPGFMHSCNPVDVDRWRFIMLFVDPGWFSLPLDVDGTVMNGIVLNRASGCDIASTLVGILKPLTDKAGPLEKEEMITAAVRYVIESSGMSLSAEGTVPGRRLETIREYIFSHFREGVTLADLENISGSDRFGIIRDFKETFRISPHAYQTILRINYSKKELRRGRQVLDVALDAGFYDQSHFIRVFKSYVGLTPSRYRIAAA